MFWEFKLFSQVLHLQMFLKLHFKDSNTVKTDTQPDGEGDYTLYCCCFHDILVLRAKLVKTQDKKSQTGTGISAILLLLFWLMSDANF